MCVFCNMYSAHVEQMSIAQQVRLTHETPKETATRCERDRYEQSNSLFILKLLTSTLI